MVGRDMESRVINGIRLQVVADLATGKELDATSAEKLIATKSRAYLDRLRRKGYAKEQCRLGFWRKIEEMAQRSEASLVWDREGAVDVDEDLEPLVSHHR